MHSSNNDLADSATDPAGPEHNGISEFGSKVVKEMNRLGIMVDVSHGSDAVFMMLLKFQGSYNCNAFECKVSNNHKRNMTDDMLKLIAKNGGVVQLTML